MGLDSRIKELSAELHQFIESFNTACELGNGFEASFIVGKMSSLILELKKIAEASNGINKLIKEEQKVNEVKEYGMD